MVNAEQIHIADKMRITRRERRHGFQQTKQISCSELLKKVSKDRNILTYQLKRLVADKDGHQVLQPRRVETIEVLDDTYMFFKVITKDMLAPGKINFTYGEGQYVRSGNAAFLRSGPLREAESPTSPQRPKMNRTKVELSVYFSVSDKNREPTKENCDKAVESPSGSIAMPMIGKDRFENEEVYVSLYSLTGCIVNLKVLFQT